MRALWVVVSILPIWAGSWPGPSWYGTAHTRSSLLLFTNSSIKIFLLLPVTVSDSCESFGQSVFSFICRKKYHILVCITQKRVIKLSKRLALPTVRVVNRKLFKRMSPVNIYIYVCVYVFFVIFPCKTCSSGFSAVCWYAQNSTKIVVNDVIYWEYTQNLGVNRYGPEVINTNTSTQILDFKTPKHTHSDMSLQNTQTHWLRRDSDMRLW